MYDAEGYGANNRGMTNTGGAPFNGNGQQHRMNVQLTPTSAGLGGNGNF